MQSRRLSERKPRTSKSSIREFPGFPSQNDPAALNSLAEARDFEGQEAPGNVDYGAVLDSLASISMSVRTRRSRSGRQSACSHSSRSCESEDHSSSQQQIQSQSHTRHQRRDCMNDGTSIEAESVTHVAAARSVMTSSRASGSHPTGNTYPFLAQLNKSLPLNAPAQLLVLAGVMQELMQQMQCTSLRYPVHLSEPVLRYSQQASNLARKMALRIR